MQSTSLPAQEKSASRTRVTFDLRDVLTPEEVEKFETSAREAGAASITEHFINLTLSIRKEGGAS
jgi:hypothetical protein